MKDSSRIKKENEVKNGIPDWEWSRRYNLIRKKVNIDLENTVDLVEKRLLTGPINTITRPVLAKELGLKQTDTIDNILFLFKRLDLIELLNKNGHFVSTQKGKKIFDAEEKQIIELSDQGFGVDAIGKKVGIHGTTVIYIMKKLLGEEEYHKRHPKEKYTTQWSGKCFKNCRGDVLQSSYEEKVVDYLFEQNINYCTCKFIQTPEKRMYADVYLIDYDAYIEIFGMCGINFYDEKTKQKIRLYNEQNLALLELYKDDFVKSDNWKAKINEYILKLKGE